MEKVYTIDDLMQAIKESGRSYDTDRIMAAYQVAKEAHKDQRRRSGEPYISHPVAVAIILVGLGMDTETLVAALLHDVVEDTATTGESIEKQFGEDVALMVNGVTKLGQVPFSTREEQQAENVRKMSGLSSSSWRTVCTICAPWNRCRPRSSGISRWRPWRSMRRWHTVWA